MLIQPIQGNDVGLMVRMMVHTHTHAPVLIFGPGTLVDMGVEMVVPALAALLAYASGQVLGDKGPLLGSVLLHQFHHCVCVYVCVWVGMYVCMYVCGRYV